MTPSCSARWRAVARSTVIPQTGSSRTMSSTTGSRRSWRGCRPPSPGPATRRNRAAAADLDELGQDRQRDLLGRLGAEVEPGRCPQRGEPLVTDGRLVAQPLADDAGSGRRRDKADVGHVARERRPDRLLVPDALARDDDVRAKRPGRGRGCRPRRGHVRRRGTRRRRRSGRRPSPASRPPSRDGRARRRSVSCR